MKYRSMRQCNHHQYKYQFINIIDHEGKKKLFPAQLLCSVCICSSKAGFCILTMLPERLHYLIIRVTPTFTCLPPPINLTEPVLYQVLLNYPALCSIQIPFRLFFLLTLYPPSTFSVLLGPSFSNAKLQSKFVSVIHSSASWHMSSFQNSFSLWW